MSEFYFVFGLLILRLLFLLVGLLGRRFLDLSSWLSRHFLLYVDLLFRCCRWNLVAMLGSKDLSFTLLDVFNLGQDFIEMLLRLIDAHSSLGELDDCRCLVSLDQTLHTRQQVIDNKSISLELIRIFEVLPLIS